LRAKLIGFVCSLLLSGDVAALLLRASDLGSLFDPYRTAPVVDPVSLFCTGVALSYLVARIWYVYVLIPVPAREPASRRSGVAEVPNEYNR
jgi:hypothetical protein